MSSLSSLIIRIAQTADVGALAGIRAKSWGTNDYWLDRITNYLNGTGGPASALPQRIILVATMDEKVAGMIAGHLSRRFNRDAELQWLDVHPDFSRQGIGSVLWRCLAHWLVKEGARNILVNVEPDNEAARAFYTHQGAREMNDHWMEWARLDRYLPDWPEGIPGLWT